MPKERTISNNSVLYMSNKEIIYYNHVIKIALKQSPMQAFII